MRIEDFEADLNKEEVHLLLQIMIYIRNIAVEHTQITPLRVKEFFHAG